MVNGEFFKNKEFGKDECPREKEKEIISRMNTKKSTVFDWCNIPVSL